MFRNLTDFSYKRSLKEAIGFYLGYLLLIVLASMILGGVSGLVLGDRSTEVGFRIGNLVAVITVLTLSFVILSKKDLLANFGMILVALLSGILAFFGGALLGLIPTAYLSTKE